MAYLAPIEAGNSGPVALPALAADANATGFSPLEWSIIRLAQKDRLWTIRPATRVRGWVNWIIGRGNPQLANERLEALRRISVLSWHYGFTVPGDDVADCIEFAVTRPPHVDVDLLVVRPIAQAAAYQVAREQ